MKHLQQLFTSKAKYQHFKLVLLLFLVILSFRIYFALNHVPFSQDQARDLFIIENKINQGESIISYGPKTSIGDFTVFPFYYQLMLLAHLVVDHPLTMYLLVTFLESLTPVIMFSLLKLFVSKKIALTGALIYSFSYLVVTYSTSAWSPNLIPLFSTLSFFCWMKFLVEDKAKYISLGVLATALTLHLHFQAVILIPFVFIVLFVSLKRSFINIKYWTIGGMLALTTFAPYITQEIADGWPNTLSIIQFYMKEHSHYFDRVSKPAYLFSFYPAFFERLIFGRNYPLYFLGRTIFFLGFGIIFYKSIKSKMFRWILLYYFSLILTLRMFKGDKLDYYLMVFFSMPTVFMSVIFEKYKKYALFAIIPLVFMLGKNHSRPVYNDLQTILYDARMIAKKVGHVESAHIVFHDLDDANIYLYALDKVSNIKFDKNSPIILDVCSSARQCREMSGNQCKYGEIPTYSALLKWDNQGSNNAIAFHEVVNGKKISVYYTDLGIDPDEKVFPNVNSGIEGRKDLIINEIN